MHGETVKLGILNFSLYRKERLRKWQFRKLSSQFSTDRLLENCLTSEIIIHCQLV